MLKKLAGVVLILVGTIVSYQAESRAENARLVVLVVVDQFRGDYPAAYERHFVDGGFRRLMRGGAWMSQAHFQYGCTATGPGHATLATGAYPAEHGIVANHWILPKENGRGEYCCDGGEFKYLGLPEQMPSSSRSPKVLLVETLGDRMKAQLGAKSQVWGVALKDRAAILTAGHKADGAIWWHSNTGNFISSTYYGPLLPKWVQEFNDEKYVDRFFNKSWDRLLDKREYTIRFLKGGDDAVWRKHHSAEFPKVLGQGQSKPNAAYYASLYASPFGNDLVFELAKRAVKAQSLGSDDHPDLLTICLGSNDVIGHRYGPGSDEVMDCSIRTDRQLASFLDWLDKEVGLNHCIVALSSDHGVGPITEFAQATGHGGGRLNANKLEASIEAELAVKFGKPSGQRAYVKDLAFPWLYLDEETVKAQSLELANVAKVARDAVLGHRGIDRAFDFEQINAPGFGEQGDLHRQIKNSYYPSRCGHVYVHWDRFWAKGRKVAVHGAAMNYDQHVPVMIMGQGIKPGSYDDRVCPTGLVSTICHLLGIRPPEGASGKKYDMILEQK